MTHPARDTARERLAAGLAPIIEEIIASFALAGIAVGVVQDGATIFARGFGLRDLRTREPVVPTSLFHMASISKPFVATAIMQLVERGRLTLDTPVAGALPDFRLADERYRAITVQQMLSHLSGMPDTDDYGWDRPEEDEEALARYVRGLAPERLIANPGERYAYSNIAYEVLGALVARVSGQSFEAYLRDNVLRPLGMTASTFLKREVAPELATTPHLNVPRASVSPVYPYNRAHSPSSTLHSSAVEMGRWALANLNRGELDGRRILQAASYGLLWHPYVETGYGDPPEHVGLSWFLAEYRGHRTVEHGGADTGFETNLVLLPDLGAAVVVLSNSIPAPVGPITRVALDLLLGFEPEPPRPPVLLALAELLAQPGHEAALARYHELHAAHPGDYDFDPGQFYPAAELWFEIKQCREAINALRLALALEPNSDHGYELLGLAYHRCGEPAAARAALARALELNPTNSRAQTLLHKVSL
ncbi:MAG TPA: serine hydrolase domain-containing protein [Ardenticatenaceae bacterium]|nr:serine hydrolase domain-containing protein [Ardenticatenaceae bacterium]